MKNFVNGGGYVDKACGFTHSPVAGRGASLGLAAEHHLLVPLQGLYRIHDAARLLGEYRTLQDAAPWGTTGHMYTQTPPCLSNGPLDKGRKEAWKGKDK